MIVFHDAHLAPERLLRLLPDLVEERYHVPVVFNTRGSKLPLGCYEHKAGTPWIEIHLHNIWWNEGICSTNPRGLVAVWRQLLRTCLHEFGHVATMPHLDSAIADGYGFSHRAHDYVERPAIAWERRRTAEFLTRDTRLAQPLVLTGYLGARHAKQMDRLRTVSERSALAYYFAERRKMKTGAQLTAGEVLRYLRVAPSPRDYRALRALDIGTYYRDAAGRRHVLYTWGDLDEISRQFTPALESVTSDLDELDDLPF